MKLRVEVKVDPSIESSKSGKFTEKSGKFTEDGKNEYQDLDTP